jgi:5-methyltetrahydrofolate corrinoid/iron sulfur protein methyltransferase
MQLIADDINILNPVVARAVQARESAPIAEIAGRCAVLGAAAIDVNPGPGSRKRRDTMTFCLQAVQAGTDLPVYLDSSEPEMLHQGIEQSAGRTVINGFSLEPSKVEAILPLAVQHRLPIVGFLLRPNGHVPANTEERLQIASDLLDVSTRAGLDPADLIIDPVLAPLSWNDGTAQAASVLETIRMLPELCGARVQTMVGLSNLTSGARQPAAPMLEAMYLARLAEAGLTHALVSMRRSQAVACARFCSLIDGNQPFSWAEFDRYLG